MRIIFGYRLPAFLVYGFLSWILPVIACSNSSGDKKKGDSPAPPTTLPKASFGKTDTLVILQPSAIFFSADSVHQATFKKQFGERDFDGVDHECFYQMKNARTSLQEHWPKIRIYEVKDTLVLRFARTAGAPVLIDLRGKKDLCGLYLFTPEKAPIPGDMMNIGTSLENYFTR